MQVYKVGGAVRDALLGLPVKDVDWVVVGSSPDELLQKGYQAVGQDFPVFLHPKTKEEYALARTERKKGQGYHGFECYYAPDVTLEEDLIRRDLTINAMAMDEQGQLVDPYNGQKDLQARVLRHVSDAFREDPLRILRVARFAARLAHLGFCVAEETQALIRDMVNSGELSTLTPERVWIEFSRGLMEGDAVVFIQALRACGALKHLLPEVDALYGVPQSEKWHPEIDTGIHNEMVLSQAMLNDAPLEIRWACLLHDVGKALTPQAEWPSHQGHELAGVKPALTLCEHWKVPKKVKQLAVLATQWHGQIHKVFELTSAEIWQVLEACDALRQPERFEQVLRVSQYDSQGRLGYEGSAYPQADFWRKALKKVKTLEVGKVVALGFSGKELKEQINQRRVALIEEMQNDRHDD